MSKTYYRFAASLVVALGLITNPAYSQTASRDGYIGVISESDDRKPGQQFTLDVGLCAEFPSLSWLEKTPEKALLGIRRLVKESIADMLKNHELAPEPISTKAFSGKFMVRIPPHTHRSLAIQAAESGISLNRLVSSKLS